MIFFMKMYDWSHLSLKSDCWLSYLNSGGKLDWSTEEAISRTVKQCWPGEGGSPTSHSVADLERFAEAKSQEAAYIEKQLSVIPWLHDPACDGYCAQLVSRVPADFLRDTIVPCLKAQVQSPSARLTRSCVLQQKHEELRRMCERQEELRAFVQCFWQN
ncbi:hypothetical protein VTI74DRAFT_2538 [Chaetomium olivicolor]